MLLYSYMNYIHLWVYGIAQYNGRILLIKKSRGPYKGQYDLPGWRIEFWETIEEALSREIMEETWMKMIACDFLSNNEYKCKYISETSWLEKEFQHIWMYYKIRLEEYTEIKKWSDWHDSLWAERIEVKQLGELNISQIAIEMIRKYL